MKINKAKQSKVQIPRRAAQGTQENEGTKESADGINLEEGSKSLGEKSKMLFNHKNEVVSRPGEMSDSKMQLETKAFATIDDLKFKTHLEQRGR